ncbi:hypothetical protein C8R44DRAFT_781582 [Mycena epipterygia]|nr:hypothetical protein C8R44DRAFT_781582 [Mycena epipterygia]
MERNRPAEYLLGPWFIGLCIDLVLQGILSAQFIKYFGSYRCDRVPLKVLVGILAVLTYLKSIQTFIVLWDKLIRHFGDVEGAVNLIFKPGFEGANAVTLAFITFYVQCYFCFRLLIISRQWWIVATVGMVFTTAFAANVIANIYDFQGISHLPNTITWYNIHLPLVFTGDIIMTTSTAYFLIKHKENVLPQSAGIFSALIRLTFQTAAPATTCALLNLVFSLSFPRVYPAARSAASVGVNIPLSKLYAFSMMWILNARHEIRERGQNVRLGTVAVSHSSYSAEHTSSGRPRSPEVEEMTFTVP